jgi:hypothetical protein
VTHRGAANKGATHWVNTDLAAAHTEAAENAPGEPSREPHKINGATKYSFTGKNLTAYGGLLPVTAMLERLEFRELVGTSVNLELKRMPRAMNPTDFLLAMILAVYVGFSRLNHLQSGTGTDVVGDLASGPFAGPEHILAFLGVHWRSSSQTDADFEC